MAVILLIETSTRVCSVGLAINGRVKAIREDHSEQYSHSSLLTVFMDEVISEAGLGRDDISAVAVSSGPGSYTGLRIGVSAAKGFCFALDVPLIAVDTMEALATHALHVISDRDEIISPVAIEGLLCPMIDARRMEVYQALFRADLSVFKPTSARIIDGDAFSEVLKTQKMFFFGDGAAKCKDVVQSHNAFFIEDIYPSVTGMAPSAFRKYHQNEFVDVAYYEPFYLKDFVAGKPKVKGLY